MQYIPLMATINVVVSLDDMQSKGPELDPMPAQGQVMPAIMSGLTNGYQILGEAIGLAHMFQATAF